MVQPNWGLAFAGRDNFQNALTQGFALGERMTQRQEEKDYRNALAQYDPSNPETIAAVMQANPELGVQLRQQQAQQAASQQQKGRDDLPVIARLLSGVQDEQTYQQSIALARQHGIETSDAPPNYDPQWVQGALRLAQAMQTPEGREALSTAGKQAVDAGLRPGTPEFQQAVRGIIEADLAQPYMGSQGETRLYTPQVFGGQQGPQPGAVEDGYRFKGGNPADPNNWEQVTGGPQVAPAAGFPGR